MSKQVSYPSNRFQMFKYHALSWEIMSLSLLTALFCIPLFALWSISSIAESNILQTLAENPSETLSALMQQQMMSCFVALPLICIATIGLGGCIYYLRKLVWDEVVSLKDDFFKGVKMNFAGSIASGIFAWLTLVFAVGSCWLISIYVSAVVAKVLLFVVVGLFVVVFVSAIMFDMNQNAIYKTSLIQRVRNSIIFAINKLPTNILVVGATFLPMVVFTFLSYSVGVIALSTVYSVYYIGLVMLLQVLYSHSIFDKYINKENYPTLVGKGLDKGATDESNN